MKTFFNKFNRFFLFLLVLVMSPSQMWGTLTFHEPGVYEKATDKGGYGATLVTVSSRQYEVYGFSYNSSGTKPQILWAGTSTNNASAASVLCSNLSAAAQEIAGWISMSTAGKSSTYSMPASTEFAASSVGSTGLYQMKMQGHSITLKVKGYDQFSFLGNDNNGDKSKGKYLQVTINGVDSTKGTSSSTTIRRFSLSPSTEYTIVITGLNTSNEHIDAFSLRLPPTYTVTINPAGGSTSTEGWTLSAGNYVKSGVASGTSVTLPTMTKDGNTFAGWKNKDDGNVTSPITITKDTLLTAQWTPAGGTQSSINYEYVYTTTPVSALPETYYEGTGVASFADLNDVTDHHFTGWSPSSIGTDATGEQTITAQWVAAYNVSFNKNGGGGSAPAGFQKWSGATFNLPGQGDMTAPSGKVFNGWKANGAGAKLAANAEYTMTAAAVEFVAQWKSVPQTIFDWTAANSSDITTDNTDLSNATYGTLTTGTSAKGRIFGTTSMTKSGSGYKIQSDDACFEIQGTSDFQEGDTIKLTVKGGGTGARGLAITPSTSDNPTTDALVTSTIDGSVDGVCTAILTNSQAGQKIRIFRHNTKNMYVFQNQSDSSCSA